MAFRRRSRAGVGLTEEGPEGVAALLSAVGHHVGADGTLPQSPLARSDSGRLC